LPDARNSVGRRVAAALLGIDVGGTFTDAVLLRDGDVTTAKVPTARAQEDFVLAAARAVGAADVERWALRLGSGGRGRHRGGDGVFRELRVLEECRLSLLSERRVRGPRGAAGGGDGAPGRNRLNGADLPAKVTLDVHAGDVITIETPGGGGYGR
jgi:Hydantoinase B/oxoprolinase/Hydantoinase/oxoprolinase N-terminal region